MSAWRRPVVVALLVGIIGAVVFTPAVSGSWIYDDNFLIPQNPYVHSLSWWPRWLVTDFWNVGDEYGLFGARIPYWRPLITATYAIDWKVGGGAPQFFHAMNILWHVAVGALAFKVLRRWLDALWPAAIAALLFAVHPTKTESVAWIAGRTDVICMVAVLVVCEARALHLRGHRYGIPLEILATLIAYTTKEQAIVLPAFVAIEGWVRAGRPAIDRAAIVVMLRAAAPQLAVAIGYLAIRHFTMPLEVPAATVSNLPLLDHAQLVLESIGRFVMLTFVPHDLSIQQGLVHAHNGLPLHAPAYVALGAVSLVALVGLTVALRRRLPIVSLGIALYLMTLAPTMNIKNTQLETLISERFLFLPVLGIAAAAGGLLVRWPQRWMYGVLAALTLLFAVQSARRSYDYANEDRFWAYELALHPDSSEARRAHSRAMIRDRRYYAALIDTLEISRRRPDAGEDVVVATISAQLLADLTPDHDRKALETIDTFCADMVARKPIAQLELRGLSFKISTTTKVFKDRMQYYELRLQLLRSGLHSRLGDDATAVELATQALAKCPHCSSTVVGAALALARQGAFADAITVLDSARDYVPASSTAGMRDMIEKSRAEHERAQTVTGPARLQAEAAALTDLELWGRAYDVLAPFKDQIKLAPKMTAGFAELAVRAGEADVAREVLAATLPPAQIEAAIAEASRRMGWAE